MFKTAEIHFLTIGVNSLNEAEHLTFHYVSAGQYHSIKQSTVPARLQLFYFSKKKKQKKHFFIVCSFVTL